MSMMGAGVGLHLNRIGRLEPKERRRVGCTRLVVWIASSPPRDQRPPDTEQRSGVLCHHRKRRHRPDDDQIAPAEARHPFLDPHVPDLGVA